MTKSARRQAADFRSDLARWNKLKAEADALELTPDEAAVFIAKGMKTGRTR